MIIAGLTGGIASGKSTVSRFFQQAGAIIIDADQIARDVVSPEMPAYKDIVRVFGSDILLPSGDIDRKQLGDIIFNAPEKKEQLNAMVHPRVFDQMSAEIAHARTHHPDAVVILDVPLLFETGFKRSLAEIIVVYVPESIQLQRLMKRDGIDEQAAMARIRAQMPIDEKRRRATRVVDNSQDPDSTQKQTEVVFHHLLTLSAKKGADVGNTAATS